MPSIYRNSCGYLVQLLQSLALCTPRSVVTHRLRYVCLAACLRIQHSKSTIAYCIALNTWFQFARVTRTCDSRDGKRLSCMRRKKKRKKEKERREKKRIICTSQVLQSPHVAPHLCVPPSSSLLYFALFHARVRILSRIENWILTKDVSLLSPVTRFHAWKASRNVYNDCAQQRKPIN